MLKISRILILLACLFLGLVYFFPLWRIELAAPQYPEGLSMDIWINKITGDLKNINILNHYIGMKAIQSSGFPELAVFPWVFGIFMAIGMLFALIGKRALVTLWVAALIVFSFVALYDFYQWEYNYGHDLNPDAAIKMEGETYQPPLIGTKELLNISATSLPNVGGIGFMFALGLAVLGWILDFRFKRRSPGGNTASVVATWLAIVIGVTAGTGCTVKQEPIRFGEDTCEVCKMTITDPRFGGEIALKKGKVYKFDSMECLTSFFLRTEIG